MVDPGGQIVDESFVFYNFWVDMVDIFKLIFKNNKENTLSLSSKLVSKAQERYLEI